MDLGATLAFNDGIAVNSATSSCSNVPTYPFQLCLILYLLLHNYQRKRPALTSKGQSRQRHRFTRGYGWGTLTMAAAWPSGCLLASGSKVASLLMNACATESKGHGGASVPRHKHLMLP